MKKDQQKSAEKKRQDFFSHMSILSRKESRTYIHRGDYQIGQYFDKLIRSSWNPCWKNYSILNGGREWAKIWNYLQIGGKTMDHFLCIKLRTTKNTRKNDVIFHFSSYFDEIWWEEIVSHRVSVKSDEKKVLAFFMVFFGGAQIDIQKNDPLFCLWFVISAIFWHTLFLNKPQSRVMKFF